MKKNKNLWHIIEQGIESQIIEAERLEKWEHYKNATTYIVTVKNH